MVHSKLRMIISVWDFFRVGNCQVLCLGEFFIMKPHAKLHAHDRYFFSLDYVNLSLGTKPNQLARLHVVIVARGPYQINPPVEVC